MRRGNKYCSIVLEPWILILYALLLLSVAVLLSSGTTSSNSNLYIPTLAGLVDMEQVPHIFLLIVGFISFLITIVSIYYVSEELFASSRRSRLISIIYAIFALINPAVILFSGASIASLAMIWSIYFIIKSKNSNSAIFISPFLASVASLFYPYIAFIIFLSIFFVLNLKELNLRNITVSLIGALFPFIFVVTLRYIFFEDILVFAELLMQEIMNISRPEIRVTSVPEILQILLLIVVALNSISSVMRTIRFYRVEESSVLSKMIILFLFLILANIVYPDTYGSYMAFIAIPLALIVCEYVNPIGGNIGRIRGADLLILFMVILMTRINMLI
jgi:hypothetical protein